MTDYSERDYLSTTEIAAYLGISVKEVVGLINVGKLPSNKSAGGQYRISIEDVKQIEKDYKKTQKEHNSKCLEFEINNTSQKVFVGDSQFMNDLENDSVHLAITSPPYFDAKMYSNETIENDLGNVHNMDDWFSMIGNVWSEVFRVLQSGRKFFLNIMNLPVRENNSFRSLNLVGKSIDLCESIGFIFKRDIIWHKTNGVKAHFGTYPYPGGILINNMHESILEFQKPDSKKNNKYKHLTPEIKERSKIDKEFWLSIKNTDVWLMKPEKSGDGRCHIAPFPLELPYRFIKAYSFIGETVLDPFCGGGTTMLAAGELGRNGIGYEINPVFANAIKERFEK